MVPILLDSEFKARCVFCRTKTAFWTNIEDRRLSEQTACCDKCAVEFTSKDVPTLAFLRAQKRSSDFFRRMLWKFVVFVVYVLREYIKEKPKEMAPSIPVMTISSEKTLPPRRAQRRAERAQNLGPAWASMRQNMNAVKGIMKL
jgi:hypothetical protein